MLVQSNSSQEVNKNRTANRGPLHKRLPNELTFYKFGARLVFKMAGLLRGEIPDLEPLKKLVRDDLRHILESVSCICKQRKFINMISGFQ